MHDALISHTLLAKVNQTIKRGRPLLPKAMICIAIFNRTCVQHYVKKRDLGLTADFKIVHRALECLFQGRKGLLWASLQYVANASTSSM